MLRSQTRRRAPAVMYACHRPVTEEARQQRDLGGRRRIGQRGGRRQVDYQRGVGRVSRGVEEAVTRASSMRGASEEGREKRTQG